MPVRTPAEHPLRLHSWRLRFYSAETMFQPAPEVADAYLRGVLSAAAGEDASVDVPELQELLGSAGVAGGWAVVWATRSRATARWLPACCWPDGGESAASWMYAMDGPPSRSCAAELLSACC